MSDFLNRQAWVFGVGAILVLAGCLGNAAETEGSDDPATTSAGAGEPTDPTSGPSIPATTATPGSVDVDDETGAVQGIVTNLEGLPLAGVTVEVSGRQTQTGPDGWYGFGKLMPYTHTVRAWGDGYLPATAAVKIVQGEVQTADLQLPDAPAEVEYYKVLPVKRGFYGCGVGLGAAAYDPCQPATPQSQFKFPVPFEDVGIVSALQVEVVWRPPLNVPENGQILAVSMYPAPANHKVDTNGAMNGVNVYGRSPLIAAYLEHNTRNDLFGQGGPFETNISVVPYGGNTTDAQRHPGNVTHSGLMFQQPYDVYVTIFYYGAKPEAGFQARPE